MWKFNFGTCVPKLTVDLKLPDHQMQTSTFKCLAQHSQRSSSDRPSGKESPHGRMNERYSVVRKETLRMNDSSLSLSSEPELKTLNPQTLEAIAFSFSCLLVRCSAMVH
jgi:hypothetical protein